MTKFSEKKQAQRDVRLEKLEKIVSTLIADVEEIRRRLAKVEVVFSGKGDLDRDVTCMNDGRRPETD